MGAQTAVNDCTLVIVRWYYGMSCELSLFSVTGFICRVITDICNERLWIIYILYGYNEFMMVLIGYKRH